MSLVEQPRFPRPAAAAVPGASVAPMPGSVVAVHVEPGQAVAAGDALVTVEAMKMQHAVTAGHPGTVASVRVALGDQVDAGAVLAVVDPTGAPPPDGPAALSRQSSGLDADQGVGSGGPVIRADELSTRQSGGQGHDSVVHRPTPAAGRRQPAHQVALVPRWWRRENHGETVVQPRDDEVRRRAVRRGKPVSTE